MSMGMITKGYDSILHRMTPCTEASKNGILSSVMMQKMYRVMQTQTLSPIWMYTTRRGFNKMDVNEQAAQLAINLGRVEGIDWDEARAMMIMAKKCGAIEKVSAEIEEKDIRDKDEVWDLIDGYLKEAEATAQEAPQAQPEVNPQENPEA